MTFVEFVAAIGAVFAVSSLIWSEQAKGPFDLLVWIRSWPESKIKPVAAVGKVLRCWKCNTPWLSLGLVTLFMVLPNWLLPAWRTLVVAFGLAGWAYALHAWQGRYFSSQ